MRRRSLCVGLVQILWILAVVGQNTVGLLSYDHAQVYQGYHLLFPHNQPNVYLLDNCGAIVHQWEDEPNLRPGNTAYLMANGDLIKCIRDQTVTDDVIWAGGGGEFVEIRDWDNQLKWRFTLNDSLYRIHHDIEPLQNGNILMIAWERKTYDEAVAAGRDTAMLPKGEIWSEAIFEVKPVNDTFEIVWEWHAWDHMIQDFDPSRENYGVVADHPELIDINYGDDAGNSSWMHMNAIDYHPVLRQILVSVPTFSEIWIIDHTTTTEQAAGHSGGQSNRGGDLMFRWGNPAVYRNGGEQKLFFQHDVHWIDEHLDASHPHFGKIAVFNNRVGDDSSQVAILQPVFADYGWMYLMNLDDTFLPQDFDWTYSHPDKAKMFSGGLSSVQFLENGNTLICSGQNGYTFEIDENQEIVWEYKVPLSQGNPVAQGTMLVPGQNLTFRVNKYPMDYPAFAGRDLSPKGFLELNPDTVFCTVVSASGEVMSDVQVSVYPNPAGDYLIVEWEGPATVELAIYDMLGALIARETAAGGKHLLRRPPGTHGVQMLRVGNQITRKIVWRED